MGLYVIEYTYDHSLDSLIHDFRPSHRTYLRELHDRGILVASGFLRDAMDEGALIILRADSAMDALRILEEDPFFSAGFIVRRHARQWVPTIGDQAEDFDTEFPFS
jgi:Uncharacterized protein conserved in bacteria